MVLTQGGLLSWPLAMIMTPVRAICWSAMARMGAWWKSTRQRGKQLYAQWINNDQAQSPPGNGDLFGIALTPSGKGFYYVMDDVNSLMRGGGE